MGLTLLGGLARRDRNHQWIIFKGVFFGGATGELSSTHVQGGADAGAGTTLRNLCIFFKVGFSGIVAELLECFVGCKETGALTVVLGLGGGSEV